MSPKQAALNDLGCCALMIGFYTTIVASALCSLCTGNGYLMMLSIAAFFFLDRELRPLVNADLARMKRAQRERRTL